MIKNVFKNSDLVGKTVEVCGWVRTRRDSKAGISFIAISDGSCLKPLQCVASNTLNNYESDILKLTTGCSIRVNGQIVASQGKGQSIELQVATLEVLGWVDAPESYPMAAKRHTMEHLREHTHLRPRTNIISAVSRVRHGVAQAIHRFFFEQDFLWVNTPIITACDCEGAGELFTVTNLDLNHPPRDAQGHIDFSKDFFQRQAFLTVSGQLNVESYAMALSKVYTFGPTFRAENSNTARHLAEFWMVEPEMAFANLDDDIALAQAMLKYICRFVLEHYLEDIEFFNQWVDKGVLDRVQQLIEKPIEIMTYTDAIEALLQSNHPFEHAVSWGIDLQTEHERYISETLIKGPVVIKDYPKEIKAFYMRLNDDEKTVAAMDVLLPSIGEIIGGSQREERFDALKSRLDEAGLPMNEYQWYLDLRRYGTAEHAGFGLGFERIIRYITGVTNVRDISPFARAPGLIPPENSAVAVPEIQPS